MTNWQTLPWTNELGQPTHIIKRTGCKVMIVGTDFTDTLVDYGFDQKSARHIAVSIMHNGYFTWYFLA